jgi:hypothetical protein
MKRVTIKYTFFAALLISIFSSCQENFNDRYLITQNSIEFNDATISSVAVGKTYPIVTRTISPTTSELSFQVNLIGEQFTEDQTFEVKIVDGETTGVESRDFTINGGKTFTIAKGTSKGIVKVQNTTTGVGSTVVVLELVGTNKFGVSKNYSKVGFRCVYP